MKKYIIALLFTLSLIGSSYAGIVDRYFTYGINSEINSNNLNGNFNNIVNTINGNLNNANIATNFRLFEILSTLPVAGEEGRIVFRTTDNTLNIDDGSAWVYSPTYSGDAVQNDVLYFDGTTWARLAIGNNGSILQSSGATVDLGWKPLNLTGNSDQIIGILPITSGGTGSATGAVGGDLTGNLPNPTLVTGIPKNVQVFTSTGTWTRPANIDYVYVKVWGGGGGGGGHGATAEGCGGGGGGGYTEGIVEVTGNVTVTVGDGGAGGNDTTGSTGGTSSFAGETTPQATGGAGGTASATTVPSVGGAGGVGSAGTVNLTGGVGQTGTGLGTNDGSGGSGGSAPLGTTGGGGGIADGDGTAGAVPGSGGGGAGGDNAAPSDGGAGGAGLVIVYY